MLKRLWWACYSCSHTVAMPSNTVRPYWSSILHWIEAIQGFPIPNDPWVILFYCTDEPAGQNKRSITPHLLDAAKSIIPCIWKQTTLPTIQQWLHIYHMEDRDMASVAYKIWACWFAFTFTQSMLNLYPNTPEYVLCIWSSFYYLWMLQESHLMPPPPTLSHFSLSLSPLFLIYYSLLSLEIYFHVLEFFMSINCHAYWLVTCLQNCQAQSGHLESCNQYICHSNWMYVF